MGESQGSPKVKRAFPPRPFDLYDFVYFLAMIDDPFFSTSQD
jgi:hypothetical protein